MLDLIELLLAPLLILALLGGVFLWFSARNVTAAAQRVSKTAFGDAAREGADPIASLSFDERLAARLKEIEAVDATSGPSADSAAPATPIRRGFGRKA